MKRDAGQIFYLMELNSEQKVDLIESERASLIWPELIVSFLERKLSWVRAGKNVSFGIEPSTSNALIIEKPTPDGIALNITCNLL